MVFRFSGSFLAAIALASIGRELAQASEHDHIARGVAAAREPNHFPAVYIQSEKLSKAIAPHAAFNENAKGCPVHRSVDWNTHSVSFRRFSPPARPPFKRGRMRQPGKFF